MRWSCLWAKTQANQTVPDRLLQCFNTSQSSSWTYVYDGVTAAPQTIELRGWGGVLEPALGTFSAIANPLLKSKVVSASTAPLVTGRFIEPCTASAAAPCVSYISNAVSGNVQIAWQSNFTGALDIKRFVNSNSANPTLEVLRLNATSNGAMSVPFFVNRTDRLQLSKAGTTDVLGTLAVQTLYDECAALPARIDAPASSQCPKGREALLSLSPSQVCAPSASGSQCSLTASISEVVPLNATGNCIALNGFFNAAACGGVGFTQTLTARPYLQTVALFDRVNGSSLGCQLSPSFNFCARYAAPSTGTLNATACVFTGGNCNTTFSATKTSALRSCLWRKSSATTGSKISCSENNSWSVPGWSGAISGPTVIELRASNDVSEPTQFNPAQNLLASVTLQTCNGPGQIPAAPGIPQVVSSTNSLSFPISWGAVSGACQYVLERRVGNGAWVNRLTGNFTSLSEDVSQIGPGQYAYRVKACNSSDNQSECSAFSPIATVNVATDQLVGFTQPCGLNVAACSITAPTVAGSAVTIAWNQNFLGNPRVEETDLLTNASSTISPPGPNPQSRTLLGGRSYRYRLFDGTSLLKEVNIAVVVPAGQFTTPCALSSGLCTLAASGAGSTQNISLGWSSQNAANVTVTEQALPSGAVVTLSGASPLVRTITIGTNYRYRLLEGANALATMDVLVAQDVPETLNPAQFALPPAEDLATTAVGATGGATKVDESGNFDYTLPIMVGKGVGEFKPVLTLNYSSGRGMGRAGMGWDLQGLEAITPCRKSIESGDGFNDGKPFPDVKFDGTDQYCLNGMRLFLEAGTGAYGAAGSFYKTEFDRHQRIRVVTADTLGPIEWRVESPDGTSKYFGGVARRVEVDASAASRAVSWPMRRITNSVNREITYFYTQAGSDQWLTQVFFDGGLITMQYEPTLPTGVSVQFQGGIRFASTKRMTGITVRSPDSKDTTMTPDSTELRRYVLSHGQINETPVVNDENPSLQFVTSVRECAGTVCLRPVSFNYAKQSHGLEILNEQAADETSAQRFADVNGDGRLDLILRRNSSPNDIALYMARSKPTDAQFGAPSQWYQPLVRLPGTGISDSPVIGQNAVENSRSLHLTDLNSDGRADLIYLKQLTEFGLTFAWRARLSNGVGFDTNDFDLLTDPNATEIAIAPTSNRKAQLQFTDLNGDGLEDMLYPGPNNTFVARLLQKPEGQNLAKFGSVIDLQFLNEFGLGCTSLSGAFKKLNNRKLEIFDINGDGFGDFILRASSVSATGCRAITDEMTVQQLDLSQFPSNLPVSSDEKPSQVAADEYVYVFVNEGRDCPNSGNSGAPSNSSCTAPQKFRVEEKLKISGTGALISNRDDLDLVRFTDINGDGLADLTYFGKFFTAQTTEGWIYKLNSGKPSSVGGASTSLFNSGIQGCVMPDATTVCKAMSNIDDVQFVDLDEDGRLDFLWLNANDSPYKVRYWTGSSFKTTDEPTGFVGHVNNSDWSQYFLDLDGDGRLDFTKIKGLGNPFMSIYRRTTHHRARHQLLDITNGLGAKTFVNYQPLTYRSVYARSYDGASLVSGRGSPVFDALSPTWVVAALSSDSPSFDVNTGVFNQNNVASIFYRYGGLKMQTGGRGSLGFKQVYTFDPQNKIAAFTQYSQAFPFTGIAEQTRSWVTNSTPQELSRCSVTGSQTAENPNCFSYGQESLFSDEFGISTSFDKTEMRVNGQLLDNSDPLNQPPRPSIKDILMVAGQASFEVTNHRSRSTNRDLTNAVISGRTIDETLVKGAAVEVYDSRLYQRDLPALTNTRNTFTDIIDADRWYINRLNAVSVEGPYLEFDSEIRYANFTYDQTTGLIASESIGSPALSIKHYCRDSFGNITKTIAQSGSLPAPNCASFGAADVTSATTADLTQVKRMTAMDYEVSGRFVINSKEVVNSASGRTLATISATKQDIAAGRTAFDAFGNPQFAETINGAKARSAYSAFGEKYFSSSNTGTRTLMRRRWCDDASSDIRCPADMGAVFVTETKSAGAPTSWSYSDKLGREILTISEGFSASQFVGVISYFDRLGRPAKVSEPFFSYSPVATSGSLPGEIATGSHYWTLTYFDALGRVNAIIAPNGANTTTQYVGLTTIITHPTNGSGLIETKTEKKDLLGRVVEVTDALGNKVKYDYWNLKDLKSITNVPANGEAVSVTSFVIDEHGRRTSSSDSNKGSYSFSYNDAGELTQQTAADGSCMLALHDFAGRITERYDVAAGLGCNVSSAYQKTQTSFDLGVNGIGQASNTQLLPLDSSSSDREDSTVVFDSFGRAVRTTQRIQNERSYIMEAKFDEFGRAAQNFFSADAGTYFGISRPAIPLTGEHVQYNARGYPEHLRNVYRASAAVPGQIYRETKSVDARGNVVEEVFANNASMTVFRGYAEDSGWLKQIKSGAQSNGLTSPTFGVLQDLLYTHDLQGNVMSRSDRSASGTTNEAFSYDKLQRLKATVRNGITEPMAYFSSGNISSKYNLSGGYAYDRQAPTECSAVIGNATPGPFALTKIGSAESFCYDSRGNQIAGFAGGVLKREISYTSFDAARVIRSITPRSFVTRFNYGAARQRLRRYDFAGSNTSETNQGKVTHYAGDAEVTTKPDGSTEVRRYISGMTQVQLIPATGAVQTRREYLMTDALGSTHRVVSEQAAIIPDGKQAFATFGERANAADRSTLSEVDQANFNAVLPRGYTGHQQADEVGIIHMNGRIYDPRLGRFLQADPLMEDVFDPQAINAYSYVRNNPMNATDPTGHWRAKEQGILRQVVALAITVSTGMHIVSSLKAAGANMCLAPGAAIYTTVATQAALAGAASGALTSGTLKGALIGALGSFTFHQIGLSSLQTSERIFAHGIAGGTLEMLGGGKFGHGFVSAGLNKALSPLAETKNDFVNGVMNAAIGGSVSEITGGDFANGAAMAAAQFAYNKLLSDEDVGQWKNTFARWFGFDRNAAPRQQLAAGASAVNNGAQMASEALVVGYKEVTVGAATGGVVAKVGSKVLGGVGRRLGRLINGCCCFAEGTLIYTANGMVEIESIAVDDLVWARDEKSGETSLKPVTQLITTPVKPLYALTTQNSEGSTETVEVTDNHPYWVIGQGWVDSGQLQSGMQIENFDRNVLTVESLAALNKNEVTYNFTVGDFHTYFVGEQRALVHNCALNCRDAFKHGFKYAPRVRARGVQDPVSHNFPYSFDDEILSMTPTPKKNGYNIFQMPGTMNSKPGVFEIGLTKDGVIDHRFFRPTK